jgi:hypothetical protein
MFGLMEVTISIFETAEKVPFPVEKGGLRGIFEFKSLLIYV